MQFEIVDSPGTNEAAITEEVRGSVQNLLSKADVVVYLFDYTKLGTSEDQAFLNEIATQRPDIISSI